MPRFLRWGHGERLSESWVASCASGLETGLQRLWCSIVWLLASCGCWPAVVLAGMDRNAKVAQQALRLWIHQRISGLTTRKPRHAIIVNLDDD